jgi:hypothetical protein
MTRRDPCNANAASTSGTRSVTAATHLGAWHAAKPKYQGRASPQSSSLSAAAAEATTLPNVAVAISGRR